MGPYSELLPLLRRRAGDVVLSIATAKDRTSVSLLLERYGVADLFPPERVFDKDAGRSKRAHLQALHEETGIPYREILFVDDKVNHLGDVAPLGVEGALASWGYNGEREQRIAREHGHRVLTLETLDVELFGDSPVSPC
jgi:phosphoglycolate phosphatase-like HAD superfamily hydrolase